MIPKHEKRSLRFGNDKQLVGGLPTQGKKAAVAVGNKLILTFHQSPGDTLVATAAVAMLHQQHPGRFYTDVSGTAVDAIFQYNPFVTKLDNGRKIRMDYDLINQSDMKPVHFLQGYVLGLAQKLHLPLEITINRPLLFFSEQEKKTRPFPFRYWLGNFGAKDDYTIKQWHSYQEVVTALAGKVQFIQVGENHHRHKPLEGAINMLGQTTTRQLLCLAYHSAGALTGMSFLYHIMAALQKPCVCVASGQEGSHWYHYHSATVLRKSQCLPCGKNGGCWKSRVVPLYDGNGKDESLCVLPVSVKGFDVGKCMEMISIEEVCRAMLDYEQN